MFRLIYTSLQSPGFDKVGFKLLCEQASFSNQIQGIQGLLLCSDSEFMQCLEGPQEAVADTYRKIMLDPRHCDIRLLVSETVDELLFDQWFMVGLATKPQVVVTSEPMAYSLLDHRLCRPWRSLGAGAADLIYEYARVKSGLEKAGEISLLSKVFEVYQPQSVSGVRF